MKRFRNGTFLTKGLALEDIAEEAMAAERRDDFLPLLGREFFFFFGESDESSDSIYQTLPT